MEDVPAHARDLDPRDRASLIVDMLVRIIVHHGLWFGEVRHQMGMDEALTAAKFFVYSETPND